MTGKIAITPRSLSGAGHPALSELTDKGYELVYPRPGATPSEEDLLASIPGCVGWLAGVEPISGRVLNAADELRVISRNGVGVNNIDLDAAQKKGIEIGRAAGANARGVAELAIALMLASFRQLPWSDAHLRAHDWQRRIGVEAKGRTLGVVGCGAIGQSVSKIAIGLGMNVLGYDPFPSRNFSPDRFRFVELDELFTQSDAITLHCPPAEEPIVGARRLGLVKQGCYLINTARAELIDDTSVLAALTDGTLAGLATDVFQTEPPEPSALLSHDRVIQTPHAGGFTSESVERATRTAVENILKVLEKA